MASSYEQLVKALRCKSLSKECDSCGYGYHLSPDSECNDACDVEQIYADAADAIEELMKNLNMASQELSWTISYAMHLMRDIDELHDMVNEVYYDEL